MTFSEWWTEMKVKKWLKYVITLVVFLIVYLFIGDQSLLQFARRGREIRHISLSAAEGQDRLLITE